MGTSRTNTLMEEDEDFDDSYFDQYLDSSNDRKSHIQDSFSIVAEPSLNPAALSSVNEPIGPVFEYSAPKQNTSINNIVGAAPYPMGYHKPNVTPQVMEKLGIAAKKPSKVYKIKAPAGSSSSGAKANIFRKGGGEVWKDASMMDWDQNDFRIFVGDLGNEATDELLYKTFKKYSSIQKARVIRDKKTGKTKGFGFVSFKEATDYLNALKEMDGTLVSEIIYK
jgi:hypothetical protein